MNLVIGQCPICPSPLSVTQLHCSSCQTTINGQFSLGRLHHLSPEQLEFVETFIRCEGKINRVEQELGLSYPAVRARLSAVILAMGYEVGEPIQEREVSKPKTRDIDRSAILNRVSSGELSAAEAARLLRGE